MTFKIPIPNIVLLNPHKQSIILLGILIIGFSVGYFTLWRPINNAHTTLLTQVQAQHNTLIWMQQAATEVKRLRERFATNTTYTQSLLNAIDKSMVENTLNEVAQQIKPQGEEAVQVSFEAIHFAKLLTWLSQLDQQYQIQVKTLTITRQTVTDLVKVRLVLQRLK